MHRRWVRGLTCGLGHFRWLRLILPVEGLLWWLPCEIGRVRIEVRLLARHPRWPISLLLIWSLCLLVGYLLQPKITREVHIRLRGRDRTLHLGLRLLFELLERVHYNSALTNYILS